MLHRRLTLEALATVAGIDLGDDPLPPDGQPRGHHHVYDDCLNALSTIVPRIDDPLASQWSKGVARALKYLKQVDLSGNDFDAVDLDEIAHLLGTRPESVRTGRSALVDAVHAGTVAQDTYVRYLWRQAMRDDYLMRDASGALRTRTWPPLRDDEPA
jgi:hypothetical protein